MYTYSGDLVFDEYSIYYWLMDPISGDFDQYLECFPKKVST